MGSYLEKCIISALEHEVNYIDSHRAGLIIGETLKHLANNNVSGCDAQEFMDGIKKGFQRADIKEITSESNECD